MDIKAINKIGENTIKNAMEKASKQGAETIVLFQRNHNMTRKYVDEQIRESTEEVEKRDFRAVGNGILWLTPCKLACERSLETSLNIVASVEDGRSWWHQ